MSCFSQPEEVRTKPDRLPPVAACLGPEFGPEHAGVGGGDTRSGAGRTSGSSGATRAPLLASATAGGWPAAVVAVVAAVATEATPGGVGLCLLGIVSHCWASAYSILFFRDRACARFSLRREEKCYKRVGYRTITDCRKTHKDDYTTPIERPGSLPNLQSTDSRHLNPA